MFDLELDEKLLFLCLDTERCRTFMLLGESTEIRDDVVVVFVFSLSIRAKSRNCSSTDVFHFSSAWDNISVLELRLCQVFVTSESASDGRRNESRAASRLRRSNDVAFDDAFA